VDFALDEDQIAYRTAVLSFAERELNRDLIRRDAAGEFDREAWNKCGAFGIQGLPFPVEYGGQGATALTTIIAMEALGRGSRDNGLLFSLNAHMWSGAMPILRFGTEEQKRKYLPGLCDGSLISVQGMTEPGSGSDAYSLATTARREGETFVLNGSKMFITNAPVADVFIVFASVDRSKGWAGLCAFIVDRDSPGLSVGSNFNKMGLRTSPMSELAFDVPATNLLGTVGSGMMVFNHSIEWERSCILACLVGSMERQLEECVAFAKNRRQFGQPIGKNQAVSHRIVDMKVRLETSRLLIYRLGWMRDQGSATALDASIVKYHLSEAFVASSLDAVQIHGALGYMTETQIERDVRDALASRIYSGTSDIQKNIVARNLGL
jgi:alkylation response protein AidB-like acyl-CoA dehydrogenase